MSIAKIIVYQMRGFPDLRDVPIGVVEPEDILTPGLFFEGMDDFITGFYHGFISFLP